MIIADLHEAMERCQELYDKTGNYPAIVAFSEDTWAITTGQKIDDIQPILSDPKGYCL